MNSLMEFSVAEDGTIVRAFDRLLGTQWVGSPRYVAIRPKWCSRMSIAISSQMKLLDGAGLRYCFLGHRPTTRSLPSAYGEKSSFVTDSASGPTLASEAVAAPCVSPSGDSDGGVRYRHHRSEEHTSELQSRQYL